MRRTKRSGGFVLCLLFNMLLNLEGLIPAAVLLVLHFIWQWSVWWAVLAAGLWIVYLILWMLFVGFAAKSSNTPDPPKKNKNPLFRRKQKQPDRVSITTEIARPHGFLYNN